MAHQGRTLLGQGRDPRQTGIGRLLTGAGGDGAGRYGDEKRDTHIEEQKGGEIAGSHDNSSSAKPKGEEGQSAAEQG